MAEIEMNIKHLNKRSKELGKEVPLMLLLYSTTIHKSYVGSEFIEKYKEWL